MALTPYILLFMAICCLSLNSVAQQGSNAILTGIVKDAESGQIIEGAIVYLANSQYGTSTGNDGGFRISDIYPDSYELRCSRVGYESVIARITLNQKDSLYCNIQLVSQPVITSEVQVFGKRLDNLNLKSAPIFVPRESPDTYCVYGLFSPVPMGVYLTDHATYTYAIDLTTVDSSWYLRMWMLYVNKSESEADFDPIDSIILHISGEGDSLKNILPTIPGKILKYVTNQNMVESIAEGIGKNLALSSGKQSSLEFNTGRFHVGALAGMKLDWEKSISPINPVSIYTSFNNSINDGLLKHHLVVSGAAVNGYVYFQIPSKPGESIRSSFSSIAGYNYQIAIKTDIGIKLIDFSPR